MSNSRTQIDLAPIKAKWVRSSCGAVAKSGGPSPGTSRTSSWYSPAIRANRRPSRESANAHWFCRERVVVDQERPDGAAEHAK